jgi:DNA invertase Pin-like site-specific DNA recombinase
MEIGYARVSTAKQDLARQLDALAGAGIETVFSDKKSGATTDRAGLQDALRHARAGDVLVVHTLDRLGRTVRDTLNLVHELKERGVGVRTLADPLPIDTSNPDSPMAQLAVVMLALFAERWSGPTRPNGPPTPRRWQLPTDGERDGLPWSMPTSSNTPPCCGTKASP